jgi:cAMP-dependent protein kinase regulator
MPSAENHVDRAIALSIGGEHEAALRWAAAEVERDASATVGLLMAAQLLGELGRSEAALEGLRGAVARSVDAGNLPLAVAACRELARLGADSGPSLDEVAHTFARGSARLLSGKASQPPRLAAGTDGFEPLPAGLAGPLLLDRAEQIVRRAARAAAQRSCDKLAPEPLFSALDAGGLRAFIEIFEVVLVASGACVIEQGAVGSEAYILARGELEVQRAAERGGPPVRLARLGAGALFGEMALLSRAPRAASVVACRPSILLVAHRDALEEVAARVPEVGSEFAAHCRHRMLENLVRTSTILAAVKPAERPALFEMFVTRTFETGQWLIGQGQSSDGLFLIASGEVAVLHQQDEQRTVIAELGPGEVVGEIALVLRRPSSADVVATHPTVALHLPRERFLDLVKRHPTVLAQLYELAVKREEETSSIVAQQAQDVDELVLV